MTGLVIAGALWLGVFYGRTVEGAGPWYPLACAVVLFLAAAFEYAWNHVPKEQS